MRRPRFAVFANASARQSSHGRWRQALAVLETAATVDVAWPATAAALAAGVRHAAAAGVDGVVVVGGDGTVSCAADALASSPVPLGVIPRGTGNDFANAWGLPRDPAAAAARILDGRIRSLDLVAVGGRHFCTAGVVGVPADAALAVRRWFAPGAATRPLIHVLGGAAYSLAGLLALLSPHLAHDTYAVTTSAGERLSGPGVGVFAANTAVLGGGLVLPVGSNGCDGRMELAFVHAVSRPRLIAAFVCLARGWRLPDGVLSTVSAEAATIECGRPRAFAADGDLFADGTRFDLHVRPQALRVFM